MENNPSDQKEIIYTCNKSGCSKEAKLRCPECKKLQVKNESYFCGKECFKDSWNDHKKVHVECKQKF